MDSPAKTSAFRVSYNERYFRFQCTEEFKQLLPGPLRASCDTLPDGRRRVKVISAPRTGRVGWGARTYQHSNGKEYYGTSFGSGAVPGLQGDYFTYVEPISVNVGEGEVTLLMPARMPAPLKRRRRVKGKKNQKTKPVSVTDQFAGLPVSTIVQPEQVTRIVTTTPLPATIYVPDRSVGAPSQELSTSLPVNTAIKMLRALNRHAASTGDSFRVTPEGELRMLTQIGGE